MNTCERYNLRLNYDTLEMEDIVLDTCQTMVDEKRGEVYLYLIYQYTDKIGNRKQLTIPRVKLPLRTDRLPSIRVDETIGPPSMREYYYIRVLDDKLPILPMKGFADPGDDPCIKDQVIKYAVKEMTQEEIEQELGYKVKIITDKEEK